ncbi:MAG TPA: hypothetical protein VM029_19590 [Opitutaceae bacterium]|nr:hypothetical protein [Opitutaceae bacterium]
MPSFPAVGSGVAAHRCALGVEGGVERFPLRASPRPQASPDPDSPMSDYWKEIEKEPEPKASGGAAAFLVPTNNTLKRRVSSAAAWVWSFAGLSVVNLVLAHFQLPIRMVVSLFVTELACEMGRATNAVVLGLAWFIAAVLIGFAVFLGFMIRDYRRWAIIGAMALLAIDAVMIYFLTTLAGLWPFLLHGAAIYFLWMAYKAAGLYHERKKNGQV